MSLQRFRKVKDGPALPYNAPEPSIPAVPSVEPPDEIEIDKVLQVYSATAVGHHERDEVVEAKLVSDTRKVNWKRITRLLATALKPSYDRPIIIVYDAELPSAPLQADGNGSWLPGARLFLHCYGAREPVIGQHKVNLYDSATGETMTMYTSAPMAEEEEEDSINAMLSPDKLKEYMIAQVPPYSELGDINREECILRSVKSVIRKATHSLSYVRTSVQFALAKDLLQDAIKIKSEAVTQHMTSHWLPLQESLSAEEDINPRLDKPVNDAIQWQRRLKQECDDLAFSTTKWPVLKYREMEQGGCYTAILKVNMRIGRPGAKWPKDGEYSCGRIANGVLSRDFPWSEAWGPGERSVQEARGVVAKHILRDSSFLREVGIIFGPHAKVHLLTERFSRPSSLPDPKLAEYAWLDTLSPPSGTAVIDRLRRDLAGKANIAIWMEDKIHDGSQAQINVLHYPAIRVTFSGGGRESEEWNYRLMDADIGFHTEHTALNGLCEAAMRAGLGHRLCHYLKIPLLEYLIDPECLLR